MTIVICQRPWSRKQRRSRAGGFTRSWATTAPMMHYPLQRSVVLGRSAMTARSLVTSFQTRCSSRLRYHRRRDRQIGQAWALRSADRLEWDRRPGSSDGSLTDIASEPMGGCGCWSMTTWPCGTSSSARSPTRPRSSAAVRSSRPAWLRPASRKPVLRRPAMSDDRASRI